MYKVKWLAINQKGDRLTGSYVFSAKDDDRLFGMFRRFNDGFKLKTWKWSRV